MAVNSSKQQRNKRKAKGYIGQAYRIDAFVALKREFVTIIKKINNPEYQTLLELRYLCFKTWEQIVVEMGYSLQHIFRIHDKALKNVVLPKDESKCDRMRVQSSDTIIIGEA